MEDNLSHHLSKKYFSLVEDKLKGKKEDRENHSPQHTERAAFCISVCARLLLVKMNMFTKTDSKYKRFSHSVIFTFYCKLEPITRLKKQLVVTD